MTTQKLKDLEAAHRAAQKTMQDRAEALKKCADQVAAVEGEISAVMGELEKLDALPTVTPKDQLAEENARRRLRQLDHQLEVARASAASAAAAVEKAQRDERAAYFESVREQRRFREAALINRLVDLNKELEPLVQELDGLATNSSPGSVEGNAIHHAGQAFRRATLFSGEALGAELWRLASEIREAAAIVTPPDAARLSPQHIHR